MQLNSFYNGIAASFFTATEEHLCFWLPLRQTWGETAQAAVSLAQQLCTNPAQQPPCNNVASCRRWSLPNAGNELSQLHTAVGHASYDPDLSVSKIPSAAVLSGSTGPLVAFGPMKINCNALNKHSNLNPTFCFQEGWKCLLSFFRWLWNWLELFIRGWFIGPLMEEVAQRHRYCIMQTVTSLTFTFLKREAVCLCPTSISFYILHWKWLNTLKSALSCSLHLEPAAGRVSGTWLSANDWPVQLQ